MLVLPSGFRILVATEPVDMRKQANGLWALAEQHLGEDPRRGTLFVFTNRTRGLVKILYWDGTGVWILSKRLEQGRFSWPLGGDGKRVLLAPEALTMLLTGIDLKKGARKAWYESDSR
jgi:transposase